MKELCNSISTLLIIFIALKLINFDNMGILDYLILALTCVLLVLSIVSLLKKRGKSNES